MIIIEFLVLERESLTCGSLQGVTDGAEQLLHTGILWRGDDSGRGAGTSQNLLSTGITRVSGIYR